MSFSLEDLPQQGWNKKLEIEYGFMDETLKIFSVEPQARLIAVPYKKD